MLLDADAERDALEPFRIRINGKVYEGKPVSWPAYQRAERAFLLAQAEALTMAEFEREIRLVFRAAFPPRWWYVLKPLADPVTLIMELPPAVRQKVTQAFFEHLASWKNPRPREDETSGPSEPNSSLAGATP